MSHELIGMPEGGDVTANGVWVIVFTCDVCGGAAETEPVQSGGEGAMLRAAERILLRNQWAIAECRRGAHGHICPDHPEHPAHQALEGRFRSPGRSGC